jgi:hypothetical protein
VGQLYLVHTFYGVSALTTGASLAVELLSTFVPFVLLRPLSAAHGPAAPNAPNRDLLADRSLLGITTLLAGFVYGTLLVLASQSFLPATFVIHFEGIPSVRPVYDAVLYGSGPRLALGLLFGAAARVFIFTPALATGPTLGDKSVARFDAASASLGETLYWNLWGYTGQTRKALVRTAVAMAATGIDTFLQCRTVAGVTAYGAAAYAGVWVVATMLTGQSLAYVGAV